MVRVLIVIGVALALTPAAAQDRALRAASTDGRWQIEALHGVLTVVDHRTGRLTRTLPGQSLDGRIVSAVAALQAAPSRRSFVVAFETLPELWEISHDAQAEPIFNGLVHDYRMREGLALAGFLNPRRTRLSHPLRELGFSADHDYVLGRGDNDVHGRALLHLVQLDVRRSIASFTVDGDPAPAAARRRFCQGREMMIVPDRQGGAPIVVDYRAAALGPAACAVP